MLFDMNYLFLVMIPSLVLGLATQAYVNGAFRRWSKVPLMTGLTGAQVARALLDANGLRDVQIEQIGGSLSDHYDPRSRVLRLSQDVYEGRSVASAGVAAHEAGHAVQHAKAYGFATLRSAMVPAANIGSQAVWPLIILGFWLQMPFLINVGILVFTAAVAFQFVTLPVELDASKRALAAFSEGGALPVEQVDGARSVLRAAALTYVAAVLISVLQLLYLVGLGRRD